MNIGCCRARDTIRVYIPDGITAQMRESLVWPARHISSISFESVCFRSFSTSTYDESVLTGVTAGGMDDGRVAEDMEDVLWGIVFAGGVASFFFKISILG